MLVLAGGGVPPAGIFLGGTGIGSPPLGGGGAIIGPAAAPQLEQLEQVPVEQPPSQQDFS